MSECVTACWHRFGSSFGFSAAATAARPPAATGHEASVSTQGLDGEIAQCLRHLSKKDAVTKLKALQTLRALVKAKTVPDLVLALPPWSHLYARLCMDSNRSVRAEAAGVWCFCSPHEQMVQMDVGSLVGSLVMLRHQL